MSKENEVIYDKPHDHDWEFDEDMKEELKKCLHNNFSLLLKI
tara:strand:+ start:136 stop:261 length:126 start_codon:yes stop_codon:yes gene_type:complete